MEFDDIVALRELQMLMQVGRHPQVVKLLEVLMEGDGSLKRCFFAFEYMKDGCLHEWITHQKKKKAHRRSSSDEQVRHILSQILAGLDHIHRARVMHRDLKPENILRSKDTWKIADFSLARRVLSSSSAPTMMNSSSSTPPPTNHHGHSSPSMDTEDVMTAYVSTRWYRAPEILLTYDDNVFYDTAVDLFGLGCIAAEIYNLRPLLPGATEPDQISLTLQLLGTTPSINRALQYMAMEVPQQLLSPDFSRPELVHRRLQEKIPTASAKGIHLIRQLLAMEPRERITSTEALQHAFITQQPLEDLQLEYQHEDGSPSEDNHHQQHETNNSMPPPDRVPATISSTPRLDSMSTMSSVFSHKTTQPPPSPSSKNNKTHQPEHSSALSHQPLLRHNPYLFQKTKSNKQPMQHPPKYHQHHHSSRQHRHESNHGFW